MSTDRLIHLRTLGIPPAVEFTRDPHVPDDLWYAILLHLEARTPASAIAAATVPIERFLAGRRWLRQRCINQGVGLDLDDGTRALLQVGQRERQIVERLLERGDVAIELGAAVAQLRESRFFRELRGFQRRDLTKLVEQLPHGANFSVPGAGKTAVTYALYEVERLRGRVGRLLVISPMSAFDAWESEAGRCLDPRPSVWRFNGRIPVGAEVVLVNYQKLAGYHHELARWLLSAPTHLVMDEAHRAKAGRGGEWGKACLDLAYLAARRDILTGTPAPQGPTDLVALIDFLWPQQAQRILPPDLLGARPSDVVMRRASRILEPFFVRTTKRELGLEPPRHWVETVDLQGLQAEIYSALRNRYAGMFDLSRPDRTMLAQMGEISIYLIQAATNPALLARRVINRGPAEFRFPSLEIPAGSRLAELIAQYPLHEVPPKFRKLGILVERNATEDRKTLIWSNFPDNLLTLEGLLARYQPALIYGGIPMDDGTLPPGTRTREAELDRFRTDPNCLVLLANPAATAEGVSLHEVCHDAIYLDRTFNAGQYLQSVDRIHRLGLPPGTETRITFLLTRRTIDEAVDTRVAVKADSLGQLLNDPDLVAMALPDDDDYGQTIEDIGDIAALFDHLRGD